MAETAIEWSEHVWNPIVGCSVVSPGCTNCYAMRMAARLERMGQERYRGLTKPSKAGAVWTGETRLADDALKIPLRRCKPTTYFVNSMSDLFHESVPDAWIDRVFAVMALCPQHTFQVLTKRSARMRDYVSDPAVLDNLQCGRTIRDDPSEPPVIWPLPNVWLGVSAEDQRRADERVPDLLATPAAVRFVSAEPLLGPIDFVMATEALRPDWRVEPGTYDTLGGSWWAAVGDPDFESRTAERDLPRLDWIIVGGESGPGARPMHPDWARQIRDACAAAGVAFLFKQWGEYGTGSILMTTGEPIFRQFHSFQDWVNKARTRVRGGICLDSQGRQLHRGADFMRARDEAAFPVTIMDRVGKKAAGRLLDGKLHDAIPEPCHG